jgi:hypothetical protein
MNNTTKTEVFLVSGSGILLSPMILTVANGTAILRSPLVTSKIS